MALGCMQSGAIFLANFQVETAPYEKRKPRYNGGIFHKDY